MPPLYLRHYSRNFHLDYAALFLFDRLIVDEVSYREALESDLYDDRDLPPSVQEALKKGSLEYADVLKSFEKAGRLVMKNFDELHRRAGPLIDKALASDLKKIPYWTKPLEESIRQWTSVYTRLRENYRPMLEEQRSEISEAQDMAVSVILHSLGGSAHGAWFLVDALKNWNKKQPPYLRTMCRETLRDYLAYINFNLILAIECRAPFMDWHDMQPLYAAKFRAAPETQALEANAAGKKVLSQGQRLFDLMFPYFLPKSPKELLKAVEDKRVVKLREFVQQSLEKGVECDSATCVALLRDVLRLEHKSILRRKITGWATLPLGIIPVLGTGIQKGAEELVNALWSDRPLGKYTWFYLLNELDASLDDDPFRSSSGS